MDQEGAERIRRDTKVSSFDYGLGRNPWTTKDAVGDVSPATQRGNLRRTPRPERNRRVHEGMRRERRVPTRRREVPHRRFYNAVAAESGGCVSAKLASQVPRPFPCGTGLEHHEKIHPSMVRDEDTVDSPTTDRRSVRGLQRHPLANGWHSDLERKIQNAGLRREARQVHLGHDRRVLPKGKDRT